MLSLTGFLSLCIPLNLKLLADTPVQESFPGGAIGKRTGLPVQETQEI